MSTTEIVKNRKYKILLDPINKVWEQVSFWTHSDSIEMPNGKSLTTNLGDIHGITDSLEVASSDLAASTIAVNTINNNVNNRLTANDKQFYFDYQNGQYGWNESVLRGADTFHPFKLVTKNNIFGVEMTLPKVTAHGNNYANWRFDPAIKVNSTNNILFYKIGDTLPNNITIPIDKDGNPVDSIIFLNDINIKLISGYIVTSEEDYIGINFNAYHYSSATGELNSFSAYSIGGVCHNYGIGDPIKNFKSGDYLYISGICPLISPNTNPIEMKIFYLLQEE